MRSEQPTEIRVATDEDALTVGRTFASGFHDDPVMAWAFREGDRAAKLGVFFTHLARVALVPLGTAYLTDGAAASWTPPHPAPWSDDESAAFADAMLTACSSADLGRLGVLSDVMGAAHPDQPYWYLGILATTRERQGQGLGSALLAHTLGVVDEAGLPAYLESTNPRNVPLYQRHGFRVTGRIDLPEGPSLTPMWRAPAARAS